MSRTKIGSILRQGDIALVRVARRSVNGDRNAINARNGRYVLAEGEATGHAHTVPAIRVAGYFESGSKTYLDVAESTAVTHQEHDAVELDRGLYEVRRQREYTPEEIRYVSD